MIDIILSRLNEEIGIDGANGRAHDIYLDINVMYLI